jgi:hypothetical protein
MESLRRVAALWLKNAKTKEASWDVWTQSDGICNRDDLTDIAEIGLNGAPSGKIERSFDGVIEIRTGTREVDLQSLV